VTRLFFWLLLMGLGFLAPAQAQQARGFAHRGVEHVARFSSACGGGCRRPHARRGAADAGGVGRAGFARGVVAALEGARLLVIDAPHISVAQAAAARVR
jgi:cobaltochelatase CobN